MKKLTKKWQIILYGCSGLGVNMLNLIVGSYLCSALLTGGFDAHIENWTYLNRDLVVAGLWAVLIVVAKIIDGLIDIPLSSFTDNLKTRFGKRRPSIIIGFIPMIAAYLLFLVPINGTASYINTIWFAAMLCVFYGSYTLTMITYYATFAEIIDDKNDLVLLSNVKSICDVIYFSLGYALVPLFVSLGVNIRGVALIFLPLALTMLIPLFMLKEQPTNIPKTESETKLEPLNLRKAVSFSLKSKNFIYWMCVSSVMNIGLQLFLSGINEFFSTAGVNMTFIMASSFAPVPLTIAIYNRVVRKKGLGTGFRYILIMFSLGMTLMYLCQGLPKNILFPCAIGCGIIVSFAIGSFFSVTYTVPSHIAATKSEETGTEVSSMFFAVQGLFEGVSTGIASGLILVFMKQFGLIPYMTLTVAFFCMASFVMSFFLPKSITKIGILKAHDEK